MVRTRPTEIPNMFNSVSGRTSTQMESTPQVSSAWERDASPRPDWITATVRSIKNATPAARNASATYMATVIPVEPLTNTMAKAVDSVGKNAIIGAKAGCMRSFTKSFRVHRIAAVAIRAAI